MDQATTEEWAMTEDKIWFPNERQLTSGFPTQIRAQIGEISVTGEFLLSDLLEDAADLFSTKVDARFEQFEARMLGFQERFLASVADVLPRRANLSADVRMEHHRVTRY